MINNQIDFMSIQHWMVTHWQRTMVAKHNGRHLLDTKPRNHAHINTHRYTGLVNSMHTFSSIFEFTVTHVCVCVKQCQKNPLHLDPSQSNSKITANLCSVSFLPLVCVCLIKGFSLSIVYLWSWFKRTLIFAHSFGFVLLFNALTNIHSQIIS